MQDNDKDLEQDYIAAKLKDLASVYKVIEEPYFHNLPIDDPRQLPFKVLKRMTFDEYKERMNDDRN